MALAKAPGLGASIPVPALAAAVDPYAMFPRCRTPLALDPAPTSVAATPDSAAQALTPGASPTLPPPHKQRSPTRSSDDKSGGGRRRNRGSPSPHLFGSRKRLCTTSLRESAPGYGSNGGNTSADDESDISDVRDNTENVNADGTGAGSAAREWHEAVSTLDHVTRVPFLRWRSRDSWFYFPGEIRNQIYNELLPPPSSYDMYAGYYADMKARRRGRVDVDADVAATRDSQSRARPGAGGSKAAAVALGGRDGGGRVEEQHNNKPESIHVRLQTPGILLVCRAISAECLPILRARTLVVDRVPPWPAGARAPLLVSQFIGHTTLRRLGSLEVRVELGRGAMGSGWVWNPLVRDLLGVLARADNALRRLRVVVKLFRLGSVPVYTTGGEAAEWHRLFAHLEWFRRANPMIWRPPRIEVEFWGVGPRGVFALEPHPVSPAAAAAAGVPLGFPRSLLDLDVYRGPWQFRYSCGRRIGDATDCELVPGSVTEFLTEDPRDRIVVPVGHIGLVVSAQDQDQYQVGDGDSDDNAYDSDEDNGEAGDDDGEGLIYSAP